MKSLEPVDAANKLPPVARTEMTDVGAGSFRGSAEYHPAAAPPVDVDRLFAMPTVPVAALCLLGLFGFYLKFEIMGPQWSLAARLYGNAGSELGGLARLGFYFDDLLINFILLPLAGALLAWWMARPLRTVFFAGGTVATTLLYFFQLRAHAEIGQYLSLQLLTESFFWAVNNPGVIGNYVSTGSLCKLALFLFLLGFLFAGEYLPTSPGGTFRARLAHWHRGTTLLLAGGIPATVLLILPFSYAYHPEGIHLHKSAVGRVADALSGGEETSRLKFDRTAEELLDEFRRQTGTPPLAAADPRIGGEKGADVLVFVLETMPDQVLDLPTEGPSLPGVGRLYDRSFVARHHFSTYPYTSDALYSLFSGLYPQGRRQLLEAPAVRRLPALMSALAAHGYVRTVYAPDLYGAELDDRMFQVFGADRNYYAAAEASGEARAQASARAQNLLADWEDRQPAFAPELRQKLLEKLTLDLQALRRLKQDIIAVKTSGRRFCSVFLPQIGHGPWLNLHGQAELAARGHDLALLQDGWLAEIVDLLAARGWLDNTLIVFTADHGLRTRAEDPALPLGKLSSYMLHVPLLIHAPRTLRKTAVLSVPTSHIDIAPTVLALLGVTEESAAMQGVPVWQRSATDRIFLLASQYAGADGYIEKGVYAMHHLLSDAVFASDKLEFADADMLRPHDEKSEAVRRHLRLATDLQISIVRRLLYERHGPGAAD